MYNTIITEKRENYESTIKNEDFITLRNLTSKNNDILESKDKVVDDYLERLINANQPVIEDEEAFTNAIMDSLPDIVPDEEPQDVKARKTREVFTLNNFVRFASSAAAIFLLGIFITLKISTENDAVAVSEHTPKHNIENNIPNLSSCSTPREMYRCYMKYRESKTIKSTLIKRMKSYENL